MTCEPDSIAREARNGGKSIANFGQLLVAPI